MYYERFKFICRTFYYCFLTIYKIKKNNLANFTSVSDDFKELRLEAKREKLEKLKKGETVETQSESWMRDFLYQGEDEE